MLPHICRFVFVGLDIRNLLKKEQVSTSFKAHTLKLLEADLAFTTLILCRTPPVNRNAVP